MIRSIRVLLALAAVAVCSQAAAQITFYELEGYAGRSFTTPVDISFLGNRGFNDRASSIYVARNRWEVCDGADFGGRCMILRPGRYPSLASMGLNDRISSVRMVNPTARIDDYRYAPIPPVAGVPAPVASAQITFYETEGFGGRSFTATGEIGNFERFGFNDRASSAVVTGDRWEVCDNQRFNGRCVVLRPGRYASFAAMGFNDRISSVRRVPIDAPIEAYRAAPEPVVVTAPVRPQIIFYEGEGFSGPSVSTHGEVVNFARLGLNDRASSVVVQGERWEVCEHQNFGGRCMVLRPGRYSSLAAMGMNDRITSVRIVTPNARIEDYRYAPAPLAVYDNRRRND
jgi:hypothetical protein